MSGATYANFLKKMCMGIILNVKVSRSLGVPMRGILVTDNISGGCP
jgi:hypothetical protein